MTVEVSGTCNAERKPREINTHNVYRKQEKQTETASKPALRFYVHV